MSSADETPSARMVRPRAGRYALPLVGIEQLWAVLALVLIGVFIALVPTPPHDFWWHLKAGQLVATRGIPTTNMFAWSVPADAPFVYATWLGEWLFYALYALGGPQAPILARNLLGLAGFGLVAAEARRRSGSWRLAALATLLLDSGKGAIAVLLARALAGQDAALIAGAAAFLGHLYPVWLGFRGGKGVATFLGTVLALDWRLGLAACAIWLATALVTRISSLSALVAAALSPVIALWLDGPRLALVTGFMAVLIFIRHSANIARIRAGTEPKIGKKS